MVKRAVQTHAFELAYENCQCETTSGRQAWFDNAEMPDRLHAGSMSSHSPAVRKDIRMPVV